MNLLPHPRHLTYTDAWLTFNRDDPPTPTRLIENTLPHPEGYQLTITPTDITIKAKSQAGLFYGRQTLNQIISQSNNGRIPTLTCHDWPDFAHRGVMLDISRDKVPTMDTLYALIDKLASWKINQIQLYLEHTFAYQNHPLVWQNASPLTAAQVQALDTYCQERFIELIPNQNSFGHMRRWLIHEPYQHMAECPDGCDTIWGHFDKPFTLYPAEPDCLTLLDELYSELLPNFSSPYFNVGCDETVDLGQGRSRAAVASQGAGRVYLDFLLKIYDLVTKHGRTMQFWGDVIMNHPELTPELPPDTIALEWGYEADHPFDKHGAIFAKSGIPFYVCPGTSTWNSIVGRTDNALQNLRNAAQNGLKHGAIGYLITHWGDNGHWQPLPASYLGLAIGAALSWAYEANKAIDVKTAVSQHAFNDPTGQMGQFVYDLGNVDQQLQHPIHNTTILFKILQSPPADLQALLTQTAPAIIPRVQKAFAQLQALETKLTQITLPQADGALITHDGALIKREYRWAIHMLQHACHRLLWAAELTPVTQLRQDMLTLMPEYRAIWHKRNRPGGFADSVARLEAMSQPYA